MSPFLIQKKGTNTMKKKSLKYLLLNATSAKNYLGLNNESLAALLGVSTDSVRRWFGGKQVPCALNIYKLYWFVYLVNELKVPLSYLVNYYHLDRLTLDSDPFGNKHHKEPWNGVSCDDITSTGEDSTNNTSLDKLELLLNPVYIQSPDNVTSVFNEIFSSHGCSFQESVRRIEQLKIACDNYMLSIKEALSKNVDDIVEAYIGVRDFNSFSRFIEVYYNISLIDERFSHKLGNVRLILSRYTDPILKTVDTVGVKSIRVYMDRIEIECDDMTKHTLSNDESFMITSISSHATLSLFCFLISSGRDHYTLSIDLGL